jgi:hypothetical protein
MSKFNSGSEADPSYDSLSEFGKAALGWSQFGLSVIPIVPRQKYPAVTLADWPAKPSPRDLVAYWQKNPDHEVGCSVSEGVVIFDADTAEAVAHLRRIEQAFGISPNLVVKTARGEHHYFFLAPDAYARTKSFNTERFPHRIDVKCAPGFMVLPPSTGKSIIHQEAADVSELSVAPQEFIDAIFAHNGLLPPRLPQDQPTRECPVEASSSFITDQDEAPTPSSLHETRVLLMALDPDESYDVWANGGMIVHHETGGSEEGLSLLNEWSAMGPKYPGLANIDYKWKSFGAYTGTPLTIGTLKWMLKERGLNWRELLAAAEPDFTVIDATEVGESGATMRDRAGVTTRPVDATDAVANPASETTQPHPLERMSITGQYQDLAQASRGLEPVLGQIAMRGQYTLIFAAPGKGKTLLTLHLIEEGIAEGRLDPSHVFYVNADDSEHGMLEKLKLAEELGIGMLVPGFNKFSPKQLPGLLTELGQSGLASETIVILDTLKKATPTNDKAKISVFNEHVRGYITLGGTFIALHHVNKNRNEDGEVVFSGTSDLVDDIDAGQILDVVSTDKLTKTQTVIFKRIKGRGGVVHNAAYRFSIADGLSYKELLASVEEVDPDTLAAVRQGELDKAQEPIIEAIKACIRAGTTLKMSLIRLVANQLGASQRQVKQVLEDHTGTDPMRHHWTFTKGVRGALNYSLL